MTTTYNGRAVRRVETLLVLHGVPLPLAWRGMLSPTWAERETEYVLSIAPALKETK